MPPTPRKRQKPQPTTAPLDTLPGLLGLPDGFDRALLAQALTHAGFGRVHHTPHNERLEFLGDAVLSSIVAAALYTAHPTLPEGQLTSLRAQAIQGPSLAAAARALGLAAYLRHNLPASTTAKGQERLLEQAFEALVGAIFLQLGYTKTREWVLARLPLEAQHTSRVFNPKGALQEHLQPRGITVADIIYTTVATTGPDHRRMFTVQLAVKGKTITTATAASKKAAEEAAAQAGLQIYKNKP